MSNNTLEIFQNETADGLRATLRVDSTPQNLTGASVVSRIKNPQGITTSTPMTIANPTTSGVVYRAWGVGEIALVGTYVVEFVVTFADSTVAVFPGPATDPNTITVYEART